MVFEWRNSSYRLDGFAFIYKYKDGDYNYASCDKEDANAVYGSGVGGCIAPLEEVKWLSRITPWSEDEIENEEKGHELSVEQERNKVKSMKTMPPDLTRNEYNEIAIDSAKKRWKKDK